MGEIIQVKVEGLDRLQANMNRFAKEINQMVQHMANEVTKEILDTRGLRKYPPATSANKEPTPYYVRGRGMQYKSKNDGRSERYGSQFYTSVGGYGIEIGNRASYAQWLTDENKQAGHMASIGWRKLVDVADEKRGRIREIFQAWINYTITRLGLQ